MTYFLFVLSNMHSMASRHVHGDVDIVRHVHSDVDVLTGVNYLQCNPYTL